MEYLLANGIAASIALILAVILTIAGLMALSDRSGTPALVLFAIAVVMMYIFSWSSTHRIVPVNKSAIIVDRSSGEMVGGVIQSGVTKKAWTHKLYLYPSQSSFQWCPQVTPSVRGGAEVIITVCITMDASQINWQKQFLSYNGDVDTVLDGWLKDSVQSSIAVAISGYEPQQLTNERSNVETAIYDQLLVWLSNNSIPVKSVSLLNWQFTSTDMKATYEASQVSIAKIDAARNEQKAAQIQSETASLRKVSCDSAGFSEQQYCLGFLQLQWLQNLGTLPPNFILSLGGNASPAVSIPAQSPAPSVP